MIESGFKSRAGNNGARTVLKVVIANSLFKFVYVAYFQNSH